MTFILIGFAVILFISAIICQPWRIWAEIVRYQYRLAKQNLDRLAQFLEEVVESFNEQQ